jgi:hypothetical protein
MSLADRLEASTSPYSRNTGCQTCRFLATLTQRDRDAIAEWAAAGKNMAQLYRECRADGLDVQYRNFKWHFDRACQE